MAEHTREEFRDKLREFIGSNNTYYRPPETVKMSYPCVVYDMDSPHIMRANNRIYGFKNRYSVKFISTDPQWINVEDVLNAFEFCDYDRTYISDRLTHWAFRIYY